MAESSGGVGISHAHFETFNLSAPGADTAIVNSVDSAGVTFGANASACRVTVALTTSSVFNVTCTDGTTTHKWGLNQSVALNAADLYTFSFGVRATKNGTIALTYDFEVETNSVIECMFVEEITGPVI